MADFEAAGGCFSEFGHNWLSPELQYFVVIPYFLYIEKLKGDGSSVDRRTEREWSQVVKVILAEVGTRSGQHDFEPFT